MSKFTDVSRITAVDIAAAIELPVGVIFKIASSTEKYYLPPRIIVTPSGKKRELDVPRFFLRKILKKLHRFIQRNHLFSEAAHGGIRGCSSFTSAKEHLGQQVVAIRDVSDCYPSISSSRLHDKLLKRGFRSDTSRLLTGLMTCRGRIPQGASTSGDALNLFLWDMDNEFLDICGDQNNYTRMADDHVISSNDIQWIAKAGEYLEERLRADGLTVNESKKNKNGLTDGMVVAPSKQCVHSVQVNHVAKTRIPRDRHKAYVEFGMKFIRAAMAVSADSLPSVAAKRRQLMGYINYSRQADLSPASQLLRLLKRGDELVRKRLKSEGVTRSGKWWFSDGKRDRSVEFSKIWIEKKRVNSSITTSGVVSSRAAAGWPRLPLRLPG